jgi:hypothetical protein
MTARRQSFRHSHPRVVPDQRPIVRSEPVIPLEIAEFDIDSLADVRQRVKPNRCCHR